MSAVFTIYLSANDRADVSNNQKRKKFAYTQGEINPISIKKILAKMNLTSEDHFVDLGSGRGRLVAQVFFTIHCKVCYWY